MEIDVLKSLTKIVVMSISPLCVCACVLYCIYNTYMVLSAWNFSVWKLNVIKCPSLFSIMSLELIFFTLY